MKIVFELEYKEDNKYWEELDLEFRLLRNSILSEFRAVTQKWLNFDNLFNPIY